MLVICEVQPKEMGLPVHAYVARDEIREDGTQKSQKVFANLPTEVGATEAEEIGVEHLLRDVKDANISTLSTEVGQMVTGLRGLKSRLLEIREYLDAVLAGKLPVNHDIMSNLQVDGQEGGRGECWVGAGRGAQCGWGPGCKAWKWGTGTGSVGWAAPPAVCGWC